MKKVYLIVLAILVSGCLGMPQTVTPVQGFELDRYLGTWYEIARLDHSFERGLERVSAEYSRNKKGGVRVVNRGYSPKKGERKEAEGKAYFVNTSNEGYLKVSFFGPFYGSYVVFELDKYDYQYAFVSGPSTEYLWLLARTPNIDSAIIDKFKQLAASRGFNIDELIFVDHSSRTSNFSGAALQ